MHLLKGSGIASDTSIVIRGVTQRAGSDGGGIVLGWLIRVALVILVVGIGLYDFLSISYARVTAQQDAQAVAHAATDAIVLNRASNTQARQLAEKRAKGMGLKLNDYAITIDKDGTVTVVVQKEAGTIVVGLIGPLAQFARVSEAYRSPPLRGNL